MDLSIVVPAYLQATTIREDLRNLTTFLNTLQYTYEIVVVVDGDVDHTAERITTDNTLTHIRVITLPKNYGKGYAIKHGMSHASGNIVGFIDAGSDIKYNCIAVMLNLMQFSRADIIIGSKRHPLSQVQYPFIRHIYSAGYQALNRILFRLNVKDTQVGVKLFQRNVLNTILPFVTTKRFAFDLELLVLAQKCGFAHIIESPVIITHAFQSTINIRTVLETLYDTIRIFFREFYTTNTMFSSGISVSLLSSHPVTQKQRISTQMTKR